MAKITSRPATGPDAPRASPTDPRPAVSVRGLRRDYGATTVVDAVDLTVAPGEFVTLLGPSGSGKTTVLTMIAGFLRPTAGTIALDGEVVDAVPPQRRNVGMVFQHYALFPHLTVLENVRYPLRMRRVPRARGVERAREALRLVDLDAFADRRVDQLSGGQQQRVALARAIVYEPRVLLMDEPLGALDKRLRQAMQLEIKRLQRRLGIAILFVTHDQEEALSMSDRIGVMNHGRLVQVGAPDELYREPRTAFVATFLGDANVLRGAVVERHGERVVLQGDGWRLPAGRAPAAGEELTLSVRPEHVRIAPAGDAPGPLGIDGRVRDVSFLGDTLKLAVDTPAGQLLVRRPSGLPDTPGPGAEVRLDWDASAALIVADEA